MRTLVSTLLTLGLLVPLVSFAAEDQDIFTEREKAILLKPCANETGSSKIRCEYRQLEHAKVQARRGSKVTGEEEVFERIDFQQGFLRTRMIESVQQRRAARLGESYTPLSQLKPTEDVNTTRLPYLNDYRQKRLECMYETPGRPRNLCLQRTAQELRSVNKIPYDQRKSQ